MTLIELKDKKQKIEYEILHLIKNFEYETNLIVFNISHTPEIRMGLKYPIIESIELDCKL